MNSDEQLLRITLSEKLEVTITREELAEVVEELEKLQLSTARILEKLSRIARRLT